MLAPERQHAPHLRCAGAVPFVHATSQYEKLSVIVGSRWSTLVLTAYATTTSPMIAKSRLRCGNVIGFRLSLSSLW